MKKNKTKTKTIVITINKSDSTTSIEYKGDKMNRFEMAGYLEAMKIKMILDQSEEEGETKIKRA